MIKMMFRVRRKTVNDRNGGYTYAEIVYRNAINVINLHTNGSKFAIENTSSRMFMFCKFYSYLDSIVVSDLVFYMDS